MDYKDRESKNFDRFIKNLNKKIYNDFKIKSSLPYKEGVEAFETQTLYPPYEKGTIERQYWYYGWYDEQVRKDLQETFDKYGIEY
jgi:hypothetical protein